jgi:hypothetical protein
MSKQWNRWMALAMAGLWMGWSGPVAAQTEDGMMGDMADRVQIHGYGELHYNNLTGKGGAADKDEIDIHRFVLFFGYEFNERIRFNSELELEHTVSGDEQPGYLQVEQAYLDFDLNDAHTARAGLFILPVGLLNQHHEPGRFYGVERNRVENRILPTTWFEGGLGVLGSPGAGWSYEAYLHSGLKTSSNSLYAVRSGRQKVAEADASDPAATLALRWSKPGILLGGTVHYQSDLTQGQDPEAGAALLGEMHADLRRGPFGVRMLYAEWKLDGDGPVAFGADRQYGWYVEPSYRINDQIGLFGRYSEWNEQAGDSSLRTGKRQWDAGVNWWPHEQVVVKADVQYQDNQDGKSQNGFNLGLGYEF